MRRLNVVTISSVYPNPYEPTLGVFVESRQRALAEHHDVHVVVPVGVIDYSGQGQKFRGRLHLSSPPNSSGLELTYVKWVYPPCGTALNALALFIRLLPFVAALHRRRRIDVLDAHFAFPEGIAAGMLGAVLGIPYVVTLRGNELMHSCKVGVHHMIRQALQQAAHVISVSDNLRQFAVSAGVDCSRTTVIPNGIDLSLFTPKDRKQARARWGVPLDARGVFSVGYLVRGKGHDRIIRSVADLRRNDGAIRLHIAGGPGRSEPCERDLRKLVADLSLDSSVLFAGPLSRVDLPEFLSAGNVFCLASDREGWPNVLSEALACGLPVVSTDVGAAQQIVGSPNLGFIVPVGDGAALTSALSAALNKGWDSHLLSAAGRSRSWSVVGREVAHVLLDAVSTSTRSY